MKKMILPFVLALSLNAQNLNGLEKNLVLDNQRTNDNSSFAWIDKSEINDYIPISERCINLNENNSDKLGIDYSVYENALGFLGNCQLVYRDIYDYTKTGIQQFGGKECNPIANEFWKDNQWDLGYASAIGAQIAGNYIAYEIDKSGTLAKFLNVVIGFCEVSAISTSDHAWENKKTNEAWRKKFPEINVQANFVIGTW